MKYYVYTHTRTDKNKLFYVGIGTKSLRKYSTKISTYYRAHTKQGRNTYWQNIVALTNYTVDIVFESNNYEECKKEEIRLIKVYGKKNVKGLLCNITDGGDGCLGINKPRSINSKFSKIIYQYDLNGSFIKGWPCGKDIERELGFISQSIYDCCNLKPKNKSSYGYQWSYIKYDSMLICERYSQANCKSIFQYDLSNNFIKEYESAKHAQREIGISASHINACCNNKRKTAGKFKWKLKN